MYRHNSAHNTTDTVQVSLVQKMASEGPLAAYRVLQIFTTVPFSIFATIALREWLACTFVRSDYCWFLPMAMSLVVFNFASIGARRHARVIQSFLIQSSE